MVYDIAHVVEGVSQDTCAMFRQTKNFAEQFSQGLVNIVIDLRIEQEVDPVRVWVSKRTEALRRANTFDLELDALYEEDQQSQPDVILADMAVENFEGINKGWMGRGVFVSWITHDVVQLTPPFWWPTGRKAIDASVHRVQCVKHGLDSVLAGGHDQYRYPALDDLIADLQRLKWQVHPLGFFVDTTDSRFEVVDAFCGPV